MKDTEGNGYPSLHHRDPNKFFPFPSLFQCVMRYPTNKASIEWVYSLLSYLTDISSLVATTATGLSVFVATVVLLHKCCTDKKTVRVISERNWCERDV